MQILGTLTKSTCTPLQRLILGAQSRSQLIVLEQLWLTEELWLTEQWLWLQWNTARLPKCCDIKVLLRPLVLHLVDQLVNHPVHQVWLITNENPQVLGIGLRDKDKNAHNDAA